MRDSAARRINSIDIARYLCAVMVVAIHTHPFEDVDPTFGFVFTQVVPRIAVPFFFAVSGFFFFGKLAKGERPLRDFVWRLSCTYAAWTFIYLLSDFIRARGRVNLFAMLSSLPIGAWYHLWFIPASTLSAALATLLWQSHQSALDGPALHTTASDGTFRSRRHSHTAYWRGRVSLQGQKTHSHSLLSTMVPGAEVA